MKSGIRRALNVHGGPRMLVAGSAGLVIAAIFATGILASASQPARTRATAAPAPPKKNLLLGGSSYTGKATKKPVIKLGLITDVSGVAGGFGPGQVKALLMMAALANADGGIMDHPVKVDIKDDKFDASLATTDIQSMVRTFKPNVIFGPASSGSLLAEAPVADQAKIPLIAEAAGDFRFTDQQGGILHGEVSATSEMDACGFAKFMGTKHPEWKRVAVLIPQFSYGTDFDNDFARCLKLYDKGAQIVTTKNYQLTDTNYLPYITALQSTHPDFMMTVVFGSGAVQFYKQYIGAGGSVPMAALIDLDAAKGFGNNIKPHFVYGFARALYTELPATASAWIKAFEKKYNTEPNDYAITGISAFLAYKAAVEKANSFSPLAVMRAFRCMTYYEPRGWVKIRTLNGQADIPEYFGALKADAKLGHPRFDPTDREVIPAHEIWQSDAAVKAVAPKSALMSTSQCGK